MDFNLQWKANDLAQVLQLANDGNEPDYNKRIMPSCTNGIMQLPKKDKNSYTPSDLWDAKDHAIFLKYCPGKRDRAYLSMANDTSARPHELLNLKICGVVFKQTDEGIQYAEVEIRGGKTGSRTLPCLTAYHSTRTGCSTVTQHARIKTHGNVGNDKIFVRGGGAGYGDGGNDYIQSRDAAGAHGGSGNDYIDGVEGSLDDPHWWGDSGADTFNCQGSEDVNIHDYTLSEGDRLIDCPEGVLE